MTMRIAQLSPQVHPVSAQSNMAIYSHVGILADACVDAGHDVHLFASGDSKTKAQLHSVIKEHLRHFPIGEDIKRYYTHMLISRCYNHADRIDIVHSHFTLLSSFYANLVNRPTVSSIHSPIREEIRPILHHFRNNKYISFSLAQRKQYPELNWVANIYHGVDTKLFAYNEKPEEYYLCIGRITREKGVHLAIEAARAAGVKLLIAGRSYHQEGYWHDKIEPMIDGEQIKYVGEADLEKKIELYQNAKGLLFPTQYDEVFGLVMIEAMSCGTPVIGWNSGSVPEVIQDGQTGYVVDSVDDMVKAIRAIDKIDRSECRKRAEIYFSTKKMVSGYLRVYQRILAEWNFSQKKVLITNPWNKGRNGTS